MDDLSPPPYRRTPLFYAAVGAFCLGYGVLWGACVQAVVRMFRH